MGGWHKRKYGVAQEEIWWGGVGGLLNFSVSPVQSGVGVWTLELDFGLWSWTGLRLDFCLTICSKFESLDEENAVIGI